MEQNPTYNWADLIHFRDEFEPHKYPANTPQKNPARVTYSAKTDVSAMRSARGWLPRHFMFDMAAFRYKKAISNIKCLGNQRLAERMAEISVFAE